MSMTCMSKRELEQNVADLKDVDDPQDLTTLILELCGCKECEHETYGNLRCRVRYSPR
jgi:hypothetical protein